MRLSVVIPTRDRLPKLERTLEALGKQDLGGHGAEVIVVDNRSEDGTVEVVRNRATSFPLTLKVAEQPTPGPSAARNTGIREARYEVVLFLGDDTRPSGRELLKAHAALHETRPEPTYAVLGRTTWAPELEVTPLMEWLERGPQFAFHDLVRGPVARDFFYTSHVSVKREMLEAVGGFDERLPCFEDFEIGARLFEQGLVLDYRPELLALHDHFIALETWLLRQRLCGSAGRALNAIRPEDPPVAAPPAGYRWYATRLAGAALQRIGGDWRRFPSPLRETVYQLLHKAAYAQGYAGDPDPWERLTALRDHAQRARAAP
jgi:glycosyltransferase involved in cell wall biosynthesis